MHGRGPAQERRGDIKAIPISRIADRQGLVHFPDEMSQAQNRLVGRCALGCEIGARTLDFEYRTGAACWAVAREVDLACVRREAHKVVR